MFGDASKRINALQRSSEKATLERQIGIKQNDAQKDLKVRGSQHNDVIIQGPVTHSILNKSSSSAMTGRLRGLNKPVPFVNPRELGIRLLAEWGPAEIRVVDE